VVFGTLIVRFSGGQKQFSGIGGRVCDWIASGGGANGGGPGGVEEPPLGVIFVGFNSDVSGGYTFSTGANWGVGGSFAGGAFRFLLRRAGGPEFGQMGPRAAKPPRLLSGELVSQKITRKRGFWGGDGLSTGGGDSGFSVKWGGSGGRDRGAPLSVSLPVVTFAFAGDGSGPFVLPGIYSGIFLWPHCLAPVYITCRRKTNSRRQIGGAIAEASDWIPRPKQNKTAKGGGRF